jgi:hypothetical protein
MQSKLGGGFAKGALGGGKGSLVKSGMRGSTRANLGRRGLVNSRALGQVRAMGPQNAALRSGGATATEANSSAATEQFEGSKPTGTAPADASGGSGSSPSSSGGSGTTGSTPQNLGHGYACDQNQMEQGGMDVNGKCVICPSGYTPDQSGQCQIINTGEAAPWKSMLDQAMQQINQAITMLIVASIIVVALIAIAIIWTDTICSSWVGAILWALALLIACMFAYMAYQAGSMVKNIAGSIGKLGGSATDYQDKLNNLGDDLQTGAYLAILGGIGGLWYAGKVSGEEDDLQNMINNQMAAPKPPSTVAPTSVTGPGDSNLGSNNLGTQ